MLKFYFNGAPNPNKVALFLEESSLPYELVPVDTRKGEQFKPEFLKVTPSCSISPRRPASFCRRARRPIARSCCPG